jgi:hypothetical protein
MLCMQSDAEAFGVPFLGAGEHFATAVPYRHD